MLLVEMKKRPTFWGGPLYYFSGVFLVRSRLACTGVLVCHSFCFDSVGKNTLYSVSCSFCLYLAVMLS